MQGFDADALDRWLTTDPRDAEIAAFEQWQELVGRDDDSDEAWDDFAQWQADMAESAAESLAESRREDAEYEAEHWPY